MSREDVAFDGLDYHGTSYKADASGDIVYDPLAPLGSPVAGLAVMRSGNKTIRLAGDGGQILGKLLKVEQDGVCAVQDDGRNHLPAGDGAVVTVGSKVVGDLGVGGARGFVQNAPATVAGALAGRHAIEDVSDPTKTWVNFD